MEKKYFAIYYFDSEKGVDMSCPSAFITTNTHIQALKEWYQIINNIAGKFKDFIYEAVEIDFIPETKQPKKISMSKFTPKPKINLYGRTIFK